MRTSTKLLIALLAGGTMMLTGCSSLTSGAGSAGGTATVQAQAAADASTPPPRETSTPPPPPAVPDPKGKWSASCDYTLTNDIDHFETHAGDFVGEVDLDNNGNVGMIVRVSMSWPQLGYAAVHSPVKSVRVPYGQKDFAVSFHHPATANMIDRLQSWESGHSPIAMDEHGCKYNVKIMDSFGTAHH